MCRYCSAGFGSPCGTTEAPPRRGLCSFYGNFQSVILFYVDESGDTNPHHEPLLDGETPLFCLSAVALPADRWRDYDRSVFALKRTYFRAEMAASIPRWRPTKTDLHAQGPCFVHSTQYEVLLCYLAKGLHQPNKPTSHLHEESSGSCRALSILLCCFWRRWDDCCRF